VGGVEQGGMLLLGHDHHRARAMTTGWSERGWRSEAESPVGGAVRPGEYGGLVSCAPSWTVVDLDQGGGAYDHDQRGGPTRRRRAVLGHARPEWSPQRQ